MTKKDYELITGAINRSRSTWNPPNNQEYELINAVFQDIILELASALYKDNPRFDRIKFCQAVGIAIN